MTCHALHCTCTYNEQYILTSVTKMLFWGTCHYPIPKLLNENLKTYLMWSWRWNQTAWESIQSDMLPCFIKHGMYFKFVNGSRQWSVFHIQMNANKSECIYTIFLLMTQWNEPYFHLTSAVHLSWFEQSMDAWKSKCDPLRRNETCPPDLTFIDMYTRLTSNSRAFQWYKCYFRSLFHSGIIERWREPSLCGPFRFWISRFGENQH